jgi:hypothetical protein
MVKSRNSRKQALRLRVGEFVEVKSESEILATLDHNGALDSLPFMPEMLKYCGQQLSVYKRADKTCDTIEYSGSRRMYDTVHLEGLRCNGEAHGGCQAACLLYWKEAWLRRVGKDPRRTLVGKDSGGSEAKIAVDDTNSIRAKRDRLLILTQQNKGEVTDPDKQYRCQATELRHASHPMPWWDIRQYARDVCSGNVKVSDVLGALLFRGYRYLLTIGAYRALLYTYDRFQNWRGGIPYPFRHGYLEKTPRATLDLKPGELVQVKSYEEILATLNKRNRNLGLSFDPEMVKYCGKTFRVLDRVERLIDEKTGKMIHISSDCIILADVVCGGHFSHRRLFCPRSLYPFWREIWLRRVGDPQSPL